MTCLECEVCLASDDVTPAADAHLATCKSCQALAADLQANSQALRAMRGDFVPERALRSYRPVWAWAAAAALVAGCGLALLRSSPRAPAVAPIPAPAMPEAAVAITKPPPVAIRTRPRKRPAPPAAAPQAEQILVQFLTPDPDVVIYWLIEPEDESKEGLL